MCGLRNNVYTRLTINCAITRMMSVNMIFVVIPEIPKTESTFEEHVILKAFLLKSMNAFAPVFYVAFFKGR